MNRFRSPLLVCCLLLALALLLTWPLPLHWATHAPGDGSDDPAILWNLWWVRYALTVLRQSPFESAWMFWPIGINLVFYTLTMLNGMLSIPVQLALGLVAANSFVIYVELTMAALGSWLLARWVLAQHPDAAPLPRRTRDSIALLSAVVYAFGSSKWLYLSLGQFNIAASHWLPWAVLGLARMWMAPDWRRGARAAGLTALFVLFTGWTEFTYASFFVQFALLFWLWHVLSALRQGERARVWRFTVLCGAMALLVGLGMAPILWLIVQDMRASGDFLVEGLGFANVFSNDLLGFLVPGNQHPLFGRAVTERLTLAYLNFAFLGWATSALAALALLHRTTRRYAASWAFSAAAFMLLSLGPTLRVNGREWELPLPFDLLLQIPLLKANRYPSRYSVMVALCLAMMVAWGAAVLWAHAARRGRGAVAGRLLLPALLLLLLFEHAGAPLPLSDFRTPAVYEGVRTRPGGALLEIPLAWRNGFRVTGTLHNSFMFAQAFQSVHQKRLLSGNTSRNPEFKFQYFTELPLIASLLALETGHLLPPERAASDARVAAELLRLLDAPTIVVRRLDSADPRLTPEATLPYLEQLLSTSRWHESEGYVGLDAQLPPAPARYQWDATHPLARLFFAEGWSALPALDRPATEAAVYAEQPEARLLVPSIAAPNGWRLSMDTWLPPGARTTMEVLAADPSGGPALSLAIVALAGAQSHEVLIPPQAPRGPLTEILFRFADLQPAAAFLPPGEPASPFRQGCRCWWKAPRRRSASWPTFMSTA